MKTEEIWKPIPGYEEWYQVSNMGAVRSCARNWSDGKWRVIKQYDHKKGYKSVLLKKKGEKKYKNFLVHRLVAIAFLGDHPGMEINHINCDKHDNRLENLEWCTQEQNREHAIEHNLVKSQFIASRKVLCIETGEVFLGVRETARKMFGKVSYSKHISACCRGEHETCNGFHFEYIGEDDKMIDAERDLYNKEILEWMEIARDLWWQIDWLDGDEAMDALAKHPRLIETDDYLNALVMGEPGNSGHGTTEDVER